MIDDNREDLIQNWHAFTARRVVSQEFRVAESEMMQSKRATAKVAFARQIAMYLAHVVYSLSYKEVAETFGRERSTVAHACAIVEDARDDAGFEQRIAKLESRLEKLEKLRRGRVFRPKSRLSMILENEPHAAALS